jgi:hypothetical protein
MAAITRVGTGEAGARVAPSVTWVAQPIRSAVSPHEENAVPKFRHHKATRCHHCDFCRPHGGKGDVRLCTAPGYAGDLVLGDQMACGQYQPAVQ